MAPPLYRIRSVLSTNTPVIYPGNWEAEHRKGWRWVLNMYIHDTDDAIGLIDEYQTAHGKERVAVGQFFDTNLMRPTSEPAWCGLYLRDTEDLVRETLRDLDDLDALARWLND